MTERYPAPYGGGPPPRPYPEYFGAEQPYGYGPLENPEGAGGSSFDIRALLGILRRNVWLILIMTALGLVGGVIVGSHTIAEYRATAVVQLVDPQRGVVGVRTTQLTAIPGTDLFGSQFEVLRSLAVLGQVVDSLGLRLRPVGDGALSPAVVFTTISIDSTVSNGDTLRVEFGDRVSARFRGATAAGGYGDVVALPGIAFIVADRPSVQSATWVVQSTRSAVNSIIATLEARRRGMTDIVDVRFTSTDPVESARVVNAAVRAFQRYDVAMSRQQLELRKAFIEEQLARTDSMLAEAQRELSDFNRRHNIQRTQTRAQAYEGQVVQLELQRTQLENDLRFYRSLLAQLEGAEPGISEELEVLVTAPGILNHPIASAQFSQLTQYVNERRSLTTGEFARSETDADVVRLDTLIAITHRQLIQSLHRYVQGLEAQARQLAQLQRQSEGTAAALAPDPEAELEAQRLIQEVSMLSARAEQLRAEQQSAMIADAIEVGQIQILEEATPPGSPLATNSRRARTAGLAIGLLLGLAGAGLREGVNNTIRNRKDLERSLNMPSLAVIPPLAADLKPGKKLLRLGGAKAGGPEGKERLVTLYDGRSVGADAFRTLRTNLVLNRAASRLKTILVTSAAPSEGKSTVASNLAVTFAQQGVNTLLVDCDVRHPSLDRIFEVDRRPGLTDWVTARNLFSECVRKTDTEHLWLLPAGSVPSNPVEFLGGERMRAALRALSDKFEVVILDTCPVLAAADPIVLGVAVDGIVVVARVNQTKRAAAQLTVEKLTRVGGRVLGVVLNDPESVLELFEEYEYGYGYYSYYGDEPEDQSAAVAKV